MAENLVSRIDVLVHPGYHSICSRPSQPDSTHTSLIQRWNKRVEQLAKVDKQSIMLYFSPLIKTELQEISDQTVNPLSPFKMDDVERIRKYKDILGDRFFLFPWAWEYDEADIAQQIQSRGYNYGQSTGMYVFGEYWLLCVKDIGAICKDSLGLDPHSVHYLPSLSRPKADAFAYLRPAA